MNSGVNDFDAERSSIKSRPDVPLSLPDYYPFASVDDATRLEWAHMSEPPFVLMKAAVPWLKHDAEVRSYLEGVIQGRLDPWRHGLVSANDNQ